MGAAGGSMKHANAASTRKFAQAYMLARELGSGAFSVVKLGVNLVIFISIHSLLYFLTS